MPICCVLRWKKRRPFGVRIAEHVDAARSGYFKTVIGRHVAFAHNYEFLGFKFLPLARVDRHDRGGEWDKMLLQLGSRWIYLLKSDQPPGLKEAVSFAPFL